MNSELVARSSLLVAKRNEQIVNCLAEKQEHSKETTEAVKFAIVKKSILI